MKPLIFKIIIFTFLFPLFSFSNTTFQLKQITSNQGVIWGMTFISDNEILFTTREGKFSIINTKTEKITAVKSTLDISVKGQGGLLDVKISPNYKKDKFIYFTYSKKQKNKAVTTLSRAILKNKQLFNIKDLLVTKSLSSSNVHFGSRITFDDEGHVYFTIGDRGKRENAQNLMNHAGTVIRLNLDGSIPSDNPYVNKVNALDEIYSYGHRNPQGIYYDKDTKKLWLIEHGPRGGDEINLIEKGLNYGWPVISYGKEYWSTASIGDGTHKKGMEQPKKVYIPSIAPSSIIIYKGKVFPNWKNKIFAGALKLKHLNILTIDKNQKLINEVRLLKKLNERIRNIIESPNGLLYISTDSGNIFKIRP